MFSTGAMRGGCAYGRSSARSRSKRARSRLSSGRTSTYLFQLRQTTMLPEGAALIGDIIVDYMKSHGIACIGGLEMGAVPIVASVAAVSHLKNYPVDAFFVRKAQKEHGARERIDGHLRTGAEVLMIDDVATTGGSILKAIEGIEGHGCPCPPRARRGRSRGRRGGEFGGARHKARGDF